VYEVGVVAQFEAAHRLIGDFGRAASMHGHTYRLEVTVRGERLDADGTLLDIGPLRAAVDDLAAKLHYQDLTAVPSLAGVNTTMEALARHCWEALAAPLRQRALTSLMVRVWESPEVFGARDDSLVEPGE
jgi:6-pyruvoyltetrahydropterin/6-carboxytetrahydropterin synthase